VVLKSGDFDDVKGTAEAIFASWRLMVAKEVG